MDGRKFGTAAGIVLPVAAIAAVVAWHWPEGDRIRIDAVKAPEASAADAAPLRFVVGSMVSPRASFEHYRELLDLLGGNLGRPVEMVLRKSYRETNEMLRTGEADAGWICTGAFASMDPDNAPRLLASPVTGGAPQYQSFIIVRADAGIVRLEDLRGRSFAYVDPLSLTGRAWVVSRLAQDHIRDRDFFRTIAYSGSHDRSIEMVADGTVDGACVDSLVFQGLATLAPERMSSLRVIDRSPPFPSPPLVASPHMPHSESDRLAAVLTSIHRLPEGTQILQDLGLERLDPPDPAAYDEVRRVLLAAGTGEAP